MRVWGCLSGSRIRRPAFRQGTKFAAYAVLRNTASVALQVSPSLYYMAGGEPGALVLPAQNLEPFQAKQIPWEAVLASGGLAAYKGDVTLTLSFTGRSEEHTSELQSLAYLVCRLLLEK